MEAAKAAKQKGPAARRALSNIMSERASEV